MSFIEILKDKQFFNIFLDQIGQLLIYYSDKGIINDANKLALETLQLNPKACIGTCIFEHCKSKRFSLIDFLDAKNTAINFQETYFTPNGESRTIVWKKITFPSSESNKKPGFLLIGNNIDKERSFVEKLTETIHFYEHILSELPTNVYWKDLNSVYLGCNDRLAKILGLPSREAIKGLTDFDFSWDKSTAENFIAFDKKVMQTGKALSTEDVFKEASGKIVTVLTNKTPLKNLNDKTIGVLAISVDITERKKMEQDLRETKIAAETANRAKSAFIVNMSHDVRGPVAGTIGVATLLESEKDSNKAQEYGHLILESSQRLLDLLDDILEMVAAEDLKEEELKVETFNLRKPLYDLKKLLITHASTKDIEININVDPTLPECVTTDRVKLYRILLNLVNNAIKFTEQGSVDIDAKLLKEDNGKLEIIFTISDTGIGIPNDKLDKIFERLFRVNPSYNNKYAGYGIGLFLVKKYVQLLKGKIKVTSELGKGTQFEIILPVQRGKSEDIKVEHHYYDPSALRKLNKNISVIESPEIEKNTDSKSRKVLIVEDDPIAKMVIKQVMTKVNFSATVVDNAEQAFQKILDDHFDLVITDIGLSGLDGNQLTRLIRQWETITHQEKPLPIIGLSAHGATQQDKASAAGMNILFTKPIDATKVNTIMECFFMEKAEDKTANTIPTPSSDTSPLGHDLPNTEEELFQLESYEVFNEEEGKSISDSETLKELLEMLARDSIPEEINSLQAAHEKKDWETIRGIAHKLKGGALYCGTIRLQYACQYMERYLLAGHSKLSEKLYSQLMQVLEDTSKVIQNWLGCYKQ